MLELKDIRFGYVPGVDIVANVSFSVGAGEFIAVGGKNGCGKTTITRLIAGLERPDEGQIFFKGERITDTSAAERSAFIGYVFQQPDRQMFKHTVAEEIAFGPGQAGLPEGEVARIVTDVMEKTGLTGIAEAYPPSLRRGEKQRVAIASALALRSQILILDEPTSGQDGKEKRELLELLHRLHRDGLTILLVTHDMDIMAADCERAIIFGYGTKAFDGTPEELFTGRTDLTELGLTKPLCVELSEAVPGIGYCRSIREFERRMIERAGGDAS